MEGDAGFEQSPWALQPRPDFVLDGGGGGGVNLQVLDGLRSSDAGFLD